MLYNAVGVGLTLVSRVQGVLAALPLFAPTPADGLGCPNPFVGRGAPRLGHAPDGRGRNQPKPGRSSGRPIMVGKDGAPLAGKLTGRAEPNGTGTEGLDGVLSSSSQGSSSLSPFPYVGICTGGAADEGVALPLEGTLGVGVPIGTIGLGMPVGFSGMGVAAACVEHGVLEYTGLPVGAPGAGVNAGALLGSNVGDAGTSRVEQGVLE